MILKRIVTILIGITFLILAAITALIFSLNAQLPNMITVADYHPLLVSDVYDRHGEKIGDFAREKRTLVAYKDIPQVVIDAFLSAEDSTFFEHGGINYVAIARAFFANLKAGQKVQGASTITQQVARSLLLSNEKTYTRKIKEVLLAYRMESNLTKEEIIYLYLNQIFLGQNAYGLAAATDVYFNKPLKDITISEAALLAGLPKAPSELNPIRHPQRSKERQRYVLRRMRDDNKITEDQFQKALVEPMNIYSRKNYWSLAPHYLDTVRQMLIAKLGEETVLDKGIKIHTGLDLKKQLEAQKQVQLGLRELDKRQGYRGPYENLEDVEKVAIMLSKSRDELLDKLTPYRVMGPDGTYPAYPPLNLTGENPETKEKLPVLPHYIKPTDIVRGIVIDVNDKWGLVTVRFTEALGLIDLETMKWARTPDPNVDARYAEEIKKPSTVLKKGDIIDVRIVSAAFTSPRIEEQLAELKARASKKKKYERPKDLPDFSVYAQLELEQDPLAEAALLALDQRTDEVISMVGGYEFTRSQLNRALQASRQTGSSFKPLVYIAALDHGFNPATPILDAPIVYEEEQEVVGAENSETITKKWKPTNHSNKFVGDILFRNALIQSLNVPSVKIIEKIGVDTAMQYARRLGVFSPLNNDFTLALGSSSVTLYEMTKAFASISRLGKRTHPLLVHKVLSKDGEEILGKVYLDERFAEQIKPLDEDFTKRREAYLAYQKAQEAGLPYEAKTLAEGEVGPSRTPDKEPPLYFKDPEQLVKPETAFIMNSLLQGVVDEPGGTGARARALERPTAGKTGTTSSYYDAWFLGYTANIATGVWVGYDQEKSLGKGEVGGRAALPIWLEYMKFAHEGVPARDFSEPENIVYASIDNDTGKLASAQSKQVVKQAFVSGTEPKELQDDSSQSQEQQQEFYKEDLSE